MYINLQEHVPGKESGREYIMHEIKVCFVKKVLGLKKSMDKLNINLTLIVLMWRIG